MHISVPRDLKQAGSSTRVYNSSLNVEGTCVFLATSGERGWVTGTAIPGLGNQAELPNHKWVSKVTIL